MGHRSLYAQEGSSRRGEPRKFKLYYQHWGALNAQYFGASPDIPGERSVDVYGRDAISEHIDELYHECVYYEGKHDDGARAFVPLRLTTGTETNGQFVLVELDDPDEWGEVYGSDYDEPLESIEDPERFVQAVQAKFGTGRIPSWSPLTPPQETTA